jgi:hypothetical protein
MAPRKWTTSEQEVWLEPWYQKFAEKQSDKSRNHKNFFADLYERWFEAFPEPRPDHVTDLGPITLEEYVNATDIRKAVSFVEIVKDVTLRIFDRNYIHGSRIISAGRRWGDRRKPMQTMSLTLLCAK